MAPPKPAGFATSTSMKPGLELDCGETDDGRVTGVDACASVVCRNRHWPNISAGTIAPEYPIRRRKSRRDLAGVCRTRLETLLIVVKRHRVLAGSFAVDPLLGSGCILEL